MNRLKLNYQIPLIVLFLFFSTVRCQQTQTQPPPASPVASKPDCTLYKDKFQKILIDHHKRARNKAYAYVLLANGCMVDGYSYGYSTRNAAIDRAVLECEKEVNKLPLEERKPCILFDVNDQPVSQ